MRAAAVAACVLALTVATGCSDGGGDDDGGDDDAVEATCLVDPGRVAQLLGYEVTVTEEKGGRECRFVPTDADAEAHPGAEVVVAIRELADDDEAFDNVVAAVEADIGPTQAIGVDHADRGFVARVGRAVQVGAVRDRRLVQVTVVDGTLDANAAESVATDLAGQALG